MAIIHDALRIAHPCGSCHRMPPLLKNIGKVSLEWSKLQRYRPLAVVRFASSLLPHAIIALASAAPPDLMFL